MGRIKRRRKKVWARNKFELPVRWISFGHLPNEVPLIQVPMGEGETANVWASTMRSCEFFPGEGTGGDLSVPCEGSFLERVFQEADGEETLDPYQATELGDLSHFVFASMESIRLGIEICWGADVFVCDERFVAITQKGLRLGAEWGLELDPNPVARCRILFEFLVDLTGKSIYWVVDFVKEVEKRCLEEYGVDKEKTELTAPLPKPIEAPALSWDSYCSGAGKTLWKEDR